MGRNDFSDITRVVVVPGNGHHSHEYWSDHWVVALQDDGHTLKLFGKGYGIEAREARDAALAGDLGQLHPWTTKDHRWWHVVKRYRNKHGHSRVE